MFKVIELLTEVRCEHGLLTLIEDFLKLPEEFTSELDGILLTI